MVIIEAPVAPEIDVPSVSEEEGRRREVLLKAIDILEKDGWTTGSEGMIAGEGPFCLLGAVAHAMGDAPVSPQIVFKAGGPSGVERCYAYGQPAALLGADPESWRESPWRWNDTQRYYRDGKERVLNALRRMANGATWNEVSRKEK